MTRLILLLLPLCLAAPAQAGVGQTAAPTLRRPLAARPVGMGEAFTAVEGGQASLGYNPAALARMARPELLTTYIQGIAEDSFSFLGYSHPLPLATVTGGVLFYDGGKIDVNLSNGVRETRNAQRDMAALGGLSLRLPFGLAAGATAKVYRLELAGEAKTTGYAADLGALWKTPLAGLNVGASLLNAGPDVRFEQEADPLPLTTRLGAAYEFSASETGWLQQNGFSMSRFLITTDAVSVRNDSPALAAGCEMGMALSERISTALRFGYIFGQENQNLTLGLGLKDGRFLLDYAMGVMKTTPHAHHVSLGVQF
ncbi:MAG: PorV/PorQ family protein [Elusimicrobiota bacterium]